MNLGEIVVVEWTDGGGQLLGEDLDNRTGVVVRWLNGTM